MSNLIIEKLLAKNLRTDLPEFRPGDTVRVHVKIKEGDKERLQAFEGVVISRTRGPQASFTVRKISFGQGVERIFPVQSKVIDKIDLLRSSKVRRAKLYYLRGLRGKAARLRDAVFSLQGSQLVQDITKQWLVTAANFLELDSHTLISNQVFHLRLHRHTHVEDI